ncbi:MAG: S8 family serine peptidase [Gemmatimonadota bacterium]|nr:MAG: S8 family serine peptidase [Gemmatimonadota bacterium]
MQRSRFAPLVLVMAAAWLVSCGEDETLEPTRPEVVAPSADVAQDDFVPGQYIVVFKNNVADPVRLAAQLVDQHGLSLRHTYQHTIKGFSAKMPDGAVAALQRNPNVLFIEQNKYWYVDTHERLATPALLASAAVAKGKPAPDPFNPPSNLVATTTGTSTIGLTWQDNTNDETGFEIERSLGPSGPFTNIAGVGTDVTSYGDNGLAENTEYCYRVRAFKPKKRNSNTYSDYSNIACATTDGTPPAPPSGDPSNLTATTVDHQRIDLGWTDGSNNEDGFSIERCTGSGCTNFAEIATVGANVTSYVNTGLQALTTYRYQVRAFTGPASSRLYSGYTNVAEATTTKAPPPPPGCNDNGAHDDLGDPGLYGITKTKANQNGHWLGVRGNDPANCGMRAEFFGLDTGVDSDHPDLNVVEIQCFLAGTPSCTGEDGHGHGTHTAGTAAAVDGGPANGVVGMAPGAKIHGYKVCTDGGSCPNDDIIAGIDAVTAYKNAQPGLAMVANMSLGGGISNAIDTAVRRSVNAGVTYTLSAGNGVLGACIFPADAQGSSPARVGDDDINASDGSNGDTKLVNGAITTTSSNQNDTDVNCNYGNPVSVAAPGSGIKSTWLNGGYNTISGTSMAAPHSAGAAILVLQGGTQSPTAVEQQIVNDLDPWTTNDLPNADGRLDARCLGTGDNSCAGSN